MDRYRFALVALVILVAMGATAMPAVAVVSGSDHTYTNAPDFSEGTAVNLSNAVPGQLQLSATTSTFPFIWIALSARGTIAKIDTTTGTILGEFSTTSDDDSSNDPSRTTVGLDGGAWAGNRGQSSVIHVGLRELNQCIDRNLNGVIETSTGFGDVKPWPGGSSGASAPVSAAQDECILHYVDTVGGDARHVSVDGNGDIWVGGSPFGSPPSHFQKVNGVTGVIVPGTDKEPGCGGYGGLVDGAGVIWSASSSSESLLRWDPNAPDAAGVNPRCLSVPNYGLAVDSAGSIWVTNRGAQSNSVFKVSSDGNTVTGPFPHGGSTSQGIAVDGNNHVWVVSSFGATTVGHLLNDGTFVGNVTGVGPGPTGIAVDAAGKVWTANIGASTASRIDPAAGPFSATPGLGAMHIGAVDLTVDLPGSSPYNYSDMTGNVLLGTTSPQGNWTVVQDSGAAGFNWHTISWNNEPEGTVPAGAKIVVEARAADTEAALGAQAFQPITNCAVNSALIGRFVQVRITLKAGTGATTPVLSDAVIRGGPGVTPGQCTAAAAAAATTTTTTTPTTTPTTTAPAPVPAAAPILPVTGSASGWLLFGGIALVLAGTTASVATRRR